ncbi:hypothetical protein [Rhizobium sophoriradicis]|uniref:hypothetical protein n=2 Tax=Rhizobium TaxID=379 RepID=UPI00142E6B63|nr:hypothetical protein [Rhizobium sophoriradicis]
MTTTLFLDMHAPRFGANGDYVLHRRVGTFQPCCQGQLLRTWQARKISIDIYSCFRCHSKYKIKRFLHHGVFFDDRAFNRVEGMALRPSVLSDRP